LDAKWDISSGTVRSKIKTIKKKKKSPLGAGLRGEKKMLLRDDDALISEKKEKKKKKKPRREGEYKICKKKSSQETAHRN